MTMGSSMAAPASWSGTRMMHQEIAAGMAANTPELVQADMSRMMGKSAAARNQ